MTDLLDSVEAHADLAVFGAAEVLGASAARAALVSSGVPGLLAAKDPTLWGDRAEATARIRLGWLDTHQRSRALLPRLREVRARLVDAGLTRIVLVASGGTAAAARAITGTLGAPLTVLDGTDPAQVHDVLAGPLPRTAVVLAGAGAGTPETDALRRLFLDAFARSGHGRPGARFVVVADATSSLARFGDRIGAPVFLADPEVDERYGALSAWGLVPAALAGVDVAALLDEADALAHSLPADGDNPALALGVALGEAARDRRDALVLADDGTGIVGLSRWIEQLVAGSTDILPVVLATPTSPGNTGHDVLSVTVGGALPPGGVPGGGTTPQLAVNGPLGAQFLVWQVATVLAARSLGMDPFAAEPEIGARVGPAPQPVAPAFVDKTIEVYADTAASSVRGALSELVDGIHAHGYLAVTAYLDPDGDAAVAAVRDLLAARADRPVTFGWGPACLRTTGRLHTRGPRTGSFLQITGGCDDETPVPIDEAETGAPVDEAETGAGNTVGGLQAARAAAHLRALTATGRPVLRLHFPDRASGIAYLLSVLQN